MKSTRVGHLSALVWASVAIYAPMASSQHEGHGAGELDGRLLVKFPDQMRVHTISNMRDHLLALQEIDQALSKNDFETAAMVAEQRLGLSSLEKHGAAHMAPFMPQAMQDIGTRMHRAASRFAIEAQTASANNDVRPALGALGGVMEQCVACHATFRLQ